MWMWMKWLKANKFHLSYSGVVVVNQFLKGKGRKKKQNRNGRLILDIKTRERSGLPWRRKASSLTSMWLLVWPLSPQFQSTYNQCSVSPSVNCCGFVLCAKVLFKYILIWFDFPLSVQFSRDYRHIGRLHNFMSSTDDGSWCRKPLCLSSLPVTICIYCTHLYADKKESSLFF